MPVSVPSVFLGVLRITTRAAARNLPTRTVHFHSSVTSSRLLRTPNLCCHNSLPISPILRSIACSKRSLWFSSIFSSQPKSVPSPTAVAAISRLEADANANPHDVSKQVALFHGLTETRLTAGYDVVITRWERMCTFDPSSPLLQSDMAFQYYLISLSKAKLESSINPAVRRRESLIASAAGNFSSPNTSDPNPSAVMSSSTSQVDDALTPSRSQQIAQAVLSGQIMNSTAPASSSSSAGGPQTADLGKLLAALGSGAGVSGNPLQVSINEPKGAWIPRLLRFLVLTSLSAFFLLVILAVLLENSGLLKAGPRQAQFEPVQGKVVKFSDVHGVDEAKNELQEVVQFLKDPTAFASLGGKLPKGILLTGSPGTGKTMLARAVAGEAGVPFFFASGSDFEEMFVGVGAKRVRDLFAAARNKQPAIIFIDELDAVGGKRSGRDQQYLKQTLNQLLVEMDGFMQNEGVIVIAATNFPESLDQALVRPGRFDRIIAVPLPDIRGRVQILQHHMRDVTASEDVDPMVLARGTPGFSGADLQNMVNQAAIQASKEGAHEVNLKHFEWAKDRIVMGAERKSQYIDDKAKLMTAYHEGGHALVALYTEGAMPLHKVTCVPRGHALGVTSQLPENDRLSVTLKEYLAEIDVCMGGRVAEELIYGAENVTSGASSDIRHATRTATAMVKNWGYSDKVGPVFYNDHEETISPRRREEIEDEVRNLVQSGQARVTLLLKAKEDELHKLAQALVEHETLDSDEVRKVIKGEPIRHIKEIIEEDFTQVS